MKPLLPLDALHTLCGTNRRFWMPCEWKEPQHQDRTVKIRVIAQRAFMPKSFIDFLLFRDVLCWENLV